VSKRALCLAAVDLIREALGYRPAECEFMPDGMPPASCGRFFVAVFRGGQSSADRNSLDRAFELGVTVTVRLGGPPDRSGRVDLLREAQDGLEDRCEELIALLHMSESLRARANEHLLSQPAPRVARGVGTVYGFSEPPGFQGDSGEPTRQGPEWFSASPASEGQRGAPAPSGYSQELRFGGARRLQDIATLRRAELP
jgi:hypothetical protein